jgi:hypothetical protein
MINLMPSDHKKAVMYARRNTFLIRWVMGVAIAAFGIIVVAGGGLFYLKQDIKSYQKSINETKTNLEAQKQTETLNRVSEISGSLKLVVDVLSSQVLFSELLPRIGEIMPAGTVLQNLNLSSGLQGGIDLEIGAVSQQAGTQAQVNLADKSNGIFEKADIVTLNCTTLSDGGPYPCQVSVRALFINGENPFLLLNKDGGN